MGAGKYDTGALTPIVVTRAHLVAGSSMLYRYPLVVPQGFPGAVWRVHELTITDRAQNTATFKVYIPFTSHLSSHPSPLRYPYHSLHFTVCFIH